jgi:hypothetical protein
MEYCSGRKIENVIFHKPRFVDDEEEIVVLFL